MKGFITAVGAVAIVVAVVLSAWAFDARQHREFVNDCHAHGGHVVASGKVRMCVDHEDRLMGW